MPGSVAPRLQARELTEVGRSRSRFSMPLAAHLAAQTEQICGLLRSFGREMTLVRSRSNNNTSRKKAAKCSSLIVVRTMIVDAYRQLYNIPLPPLFMATVSGTSPNRCRVSVLARESIVICARNPRASSQRQLHSWLAEHRCCRFVRSCPAHLHSHKGYKARDWSRASTANRITLSNLPRSRSISGGVLQTSKPQARCCSAFQGCTRGTN